MDTGEEDRTKHTPLPLTSAYYEQDLSDAQYFTFRRNVPYLALLLIFHPLARKVCNYVRPIPARSNSPKPNGYASFADGEARKEQRVSFDFGFALIFLAAMHGFSALKVLLILFTNYCIATGLPRKTIPVATWIFNIAILFANEIGDGYQFARIADHISPTATHDLLRGVGEWLDGYSGIMPRWHILFNITVLRLISFNLDYYWSLDRRSGSPEEVGSQVLAVYFPMLMRPRRSNSTPPISRRETASRSPQMPRITAFEIMLHMPSMPLFIWLGLFSLSTTTSLNSNSHLLVLRLREQSNMEFAFSFAFWPWKYFCTSIIV